MLLEDRPRVADLLGAVAAVEFHERPGGAADLVEESAPLASVWLPIKLRTTRKCRSQLSTVRKCFRKTRIPRSSAGRTRQRADLRGAFVIPRNAKGRQPFS